MANSLNQNTIYNSENDTFDFSYWDQLTYSQRFEVMLMYMYPSMRGVWTGVDPIVENEPYVDGTTIPVPSFGFRTFCSEANLWGSLVREQLQETFSYYESNLGVCCCYYTSDFNGNRFLNRCLLCQEYRDEYDHSSNDSDDVDSFDGDDGDDDDRDDFARGIVPRVTRLLFSQVVDRNCAICLSDGFEFYASLPCDHQFHERCINDWFVQSRRITCPMCRAIPQMFSTFNPISRVNEVADRANVLLDRINTYIDTTVGNVDQMFENISAAFKIAGKMCVGFDTIMRLITLFKFNDGMVDQINFYWNLIKIFQNVLSLYITHNDEFFDADDDAYSQGFLDSLLTSTVISSMLPPKWNKVLDFISRHSRIKFLSDVNTFDGSLNYVLSLPLVCLKYLEQNAPFGRTIGHLSRFYEKMLLALPGSLHNRMQKRAVDVCVKFLKDASVVRSSEYVEEFKEVLAFYEECEILEYSDSDHIPEGFKMTISTLKNIRSIIGSMSRVTRTLPVWLYAYGPSGSGKSTLFSEITRSMSENYTFYSHQQIKGQKDFYDGYNGENVFWEDDIIEEVQLLKYLKMASTFATPLECSDIKMKGLKKFTSQFIFTSSNMRPEDLIKNPEHKKAIMRRMILLDFSEVTCDALSYYPANKKDKCAKITAYQYDPVTDVISVFDTFDPNKGVDWFSSRCFQLLDVYARLHAAQTARVVQIPKRPLPQGLDDLVDYFKQMYVEYSPSQIIQKIRDQIPTCDICAYACSMQCTTTCCRQKVCYACVARMNFVNNQFKCPFCRQMSDSTTLDKIKTTIIGGINKCGGVACDSWNSAVAMLTTGDFWKSVSLSVVASLIGISIATCVEWMLRKPREKVENVPVKYVAPKDYGNIRRARLEFNAPMYAISQGMYPKRISQEFPSQFEALRNNMLYINVTNENGSVNGIGLMLDGQRLLLPAHFVLRLGNETSLFRVYGDDQEGAQLLSGKEMKIVYMNVEDDVCILTFCAKVPNLFKSVVKRFDTSKCKNKELFLLTPDEFGKINYPTQAQISLPYFNSSGVEVFYPKDSTEYDFQNDGLCGALLCDGDGFVLGFHVAFNPIKKKGVARPFRRSLKREVLNKNIDGEQRILSPISAYIVKSPIYRSVPEDSSIMPSDLFGVFPVTRAPAILKGVNPDGENVLKKALVKNIKPVKGVDEKALEFARFAVSRMLGSKKSVPLSENEIVCGSPGRFPGFDKRSSSGIPYSCKNGELLDYEHGSLGERVHAEIRKMKDEFENDCFGIHTVVFGDTLKDELRDLPKVWKPRLFAAGPVHFAAELKRLFGDIVYRTQRNRMRNGIMIGINPLGKEWDVFARKMTRLGWRMIPGDFENWDGGMLSSFQEDAIDILSDLTYEPEYAKWLLCHLMSTTRAVLGEAIVTTHSIPSGHFLTAFFNSIINAMYIAYAYYILCGGNDLDFEQIYNDFTSNIFSAKYGDDVFINVHERISEIFNAFSFAKVMEDIGVGFTTETKKKHEKPFYLLEECTFLKRSFSFSTKLNRIVGPLNRDTMLSTLSYVSDFSRMEELVDLKVNNFQREAFLHPDYHSLIEQLSVRYEEEYGFPPPLLDDEELLHLYENDLIDSPFANLDQINLVVRGMFDSSTVE